MLLRKGIALCQPFDAWKGGTLAGTVSLARLLAGQGDYDEALERIAAQKASPYLSNDERAYLDAGYRTRRFDAG